MCMERRPCDGRSLVWIPNLPLTLLFAANLGLGDEEIALLETNDAASMIVLLFARTEILRFVLYKISFRSYHEETHHLLSH